MKTKRRLVQFGFLALTIVGVYVLKGNAERWCPFGGVEALYMYFSQGHMLCSLGVSNFYILGAVLVLTLLLRRVFCGYMCPIGAISEWLGAGAKRLGIKPRKIPPTADRILSLGKYGVLAVVLYFTLKAGELMFRTADPCYALISRHGEDITYWAYVVTGVIVIGSLFITIPFCRWFCPLAAVLNPFSKLGLARIRRNESTCIDCGKCARVCPMAIPVSTVKQVTAARCMSCLDCLDSCPELKGGALTWGPAGSSRSWSQGVLISLVFAAVISAVAAAYMAPLPSYVWERGQRPAEMASVDLQIHDLTCRGRATMLTQFFIDRDDMFELPGYIKVEAWPGPGIALARVFFDPAQTSADAVKQAITEPYYNLAEESSVLGEGAWTSSPFIIEGYGIDDIPPASEPAP
jgi:ferredoxin